MNLYFINNNNRRRLTIPIIANVIASSKNECLVVLTRHLSNLSESVFCDDSMLLESEEQRLVSAIELAEVFNLENEEELARVVYYEGP